MAEVGSGGELVLIWIVLKRRRAGRDGRGVQRVVVLVTVPNAAVAGVVAGWCPGLAVRLAAVLVLVRRLATGAVPLGVQVVSIETELAPALE